jgi:hypothetical protein
MMRSLFLDFQLEFVTAADREMSEDVLLRMLGMLAMLNLYQLRKHSDLPSIYSKAAGIKYCPPDQMEGCWVDQSKVKDLAKYLKSIGATDTKIAIILRLISGTEIFQDALTLHRSKKGDCDRLVATRLAELWRAGIMASPYLIQFPNGTGGITYHAVIKHIDGSSEDPSAILGMNVKPGVREEEIRKNIERHDNLVKDATEIMLMDPGQSPEMLGSVLDLAGYLPRGGYAL